MNFDLVVTRHSGLVDYLKDLGVVNDSTKVVSHVTNPADLYGKAVVGVLPINLAACCKVYAMIPLKIPADLRGVDLNKDQVKQYGGKLTYYDVCIVSSKHTM